MLPKLRLIALAVCYLRAFLTFSPALRHTSAFVGRVHLHSPDWHASVATSHSKEQFNLKTRRRCQDGLFMNSRLFSNVPHPTKVAFQVRGATDRGQPQPHTQRRAMSFASSRELRCMATPSGRSHINVVVKLWRDSSSSVVS